VEGDILTLDYNGQITRLKRSPELRRGALKTMEWLNHSSENSRRIAS
jgi:hypothetical protein